jgi:hypothetical protein
MNILSSRKYKKSLLNSKYFIDNFFNASDSKFEFDSRFIYETKKLENCQNFNEILSYLNSFKLFDNQILREIFKENNIKRFKIELLQNIFEFSDQNFKYLEGQMNKKLEILELYYLTKKSSTKTDLQIEISLSKNVNWEVFDRIVLDFDSILQSISKEMKILYKQKRILTENVKSFFNLTQRTFLKIITTPMRISRTFST